MPKFTITVELDDADQLYLLQNAIERGINNAIWVGRRVEKKTAGDMSERASTLWQDFEEVKPLLCKIWGATQEAVRVGAQSNKP